MTTENDNPPEDAARNRRSSRSDGSAPISIALDRITELEAAAIDPANQSFDQKCLLAAGAGYRKTNERVRELLRAWDDGANYRDMAPAVAALRVALGEPNAPAQERRTGDPKS